MGVQPDDEASEKDSGGLQPTQSHDSEDTARDPETGLFSTSSGSKPDPPGISSNRSQSLIQDDDTIYAKKAMDDVNAEDVPIPTELRRAAQSPPGAFRQGGNQFDDSSTVRSADPPAHLVSATLVNHEEESAPVKPLEPSVLATAEPVFHKRPWKYIGMGILGLMGLVVGLSLAFTGRGDGDGGETIVVDANGNIIGELENGQLEIDEDAGNNLFGKAQRFSYHSVSWGVSPNCRLPDDDVPRELATLELSCDNVRSELDILDANGAFCTFTNTSRAICQHTLGDFNSTMILRCTVPPSSNGEVNIETRGTRKVDCDPMFQDETPVAIEYLSLARICKKYIDDQTRWTVSSTRYPCQQGRPHETYSGRDFCFSVDECVVQRECGGGDRDVPDCDLCIAETKPLLVSDNDEYLQCTASETEVPSLQELRLAVAVTSPGAFWNDVDPGVLYGGLPSRGGEGGSFESFGFLGGGGGGK